MSWTKYDRTFSFFIHFPKGPKFGLIYYYLIKDAIEDFYHYVHENSKRIRLYVRHYNIELFLDIFLNFFANFIFIYVFLLELLVVVKFSSYFIFNNFLD